jgi:tetratricopeptide (TPR) repeat protein
MKNEYGLDSTLRYNGSLTTIKTLIANGFYILVEDWLHPNEDIGHDTIIRGYDDTQGVLISDDSYLGVNITYPYVRFDEQQWKPFNREYAVFYRPEQADKVKAIIGADWDDKTMYTHAVAQARREIAQNDQDFYAQFNLGTSLYGLSQFAEAAQAFAAAKQLGWPKRMLWYQIQPVQTLNELGKYNDALQMANQALTGNETFAEMHLEKARAHKGLGQTNQARLEAQAATGYAPDFQPAWEFLRTL